MQLRTIISFLVLCTFILTVASAQKNMKMYAILCGQTEVFDIGRGCEVSVDKMTRFLEGVGNQLEMPVEHLTITGSDFTKDNILQAIADLELEDPDSSVIVFYATSHGFNYDGDATNYAFFGAHPRKKHLTRSEFEEFGLSLELEVHQAMMAKGARLTLSLGEACNNLLDIPTPESYYMPMNINVHQRMKELFVESEGDIISTSSDLGQFSWTDPREGGIWTNQFLRSFFQVMASEERATWDEVFERTGQYTLDESQSEANFEQRPRSDIDLINTPMQLVPEEVEVKTSRQNRKMEKNLQKQGYIIPRIKVIKE